MSPILDDPFPLGDDELSKKLAARRAALQQSYNANALEAEATPELSGTQVGASAAIKLLPLLLGMAIAKRRNVGAALGADAGLKYSGVYEQGELADQESKIKQSGLRANQALKDLSTIDSEAIKIAKQKDAQRYQDRSREDTQTFQSEQGRLNRNAADERARLSREKGNEPIDEATGKVLSEIGIEGISNQKNANLALGAKRIKAEQDRESRLTVAQQAKLTSLRAPGFEVLEGYAPTPKDTESMSALNGARLTMNGLIKKTEDLIKTRGVDFLGKDAKAREQLSQAMVSAKNKIDGYGAALTNSERATITRQLPDIDSFIDYVISSAKGTNDPFAALKQLRAITDNTVASGALARKSFLIGYQYDPEVVTQYGIPVDAQGRAKKTDWFKTTLGQHNMLLGSDEAPSQGEGRGSSDMPTDQDLTDPGYLAWRKKKKGY